MNVRTGVLAIALIGMITMGACANDAAPAGQDEAIPAEQSSAELAEQSEAASMDPQAAQASQPESAEEFTYLLSGGAQVDYEPLASPAEALEFADVIVTGTITDVIPDGSDRVQIEIAVDDVLYGSQPDGGVLYVTHGFEGWVAGTGGTTKVTVKDLAESGIGLDVVAVAEDVTEVAAGTESPAGHRVFTVAIDGFWLEGSGDHHMSGVYVQADDLSGERWGQVTTIEQFTGAIRDEVAASSSSPTP
ncbi:hypothetical protein [Phytoactinopolyspora limicola]|uniref:hypothetical protein n=1 Tax=Phytoactinopolyspora limicola TaxID=2715536 RepID=UPI00140D1434|nr:hypothetical protein [Phytoactinopolyspora limicola]